MINPNDFTRELIRNGLEFYTGVPDSLLKSFNSEICNLVHDDMHVVAANEGCAIAIAAGYHLATEKVPVVYLQNSGIGNCINPIVSLVDKQIYSIPMILVIGWRGYPGEKDEPQHLVQGAVMEDLLKSIRLDYVCIDANTDYKKVIAEFAKKAKDSSCPVVILVRPNTFDTLCNYTSQLNQEVLEMSREDAIGLIGGFFNKNPIISTTGMISRELYDFRCKTNQECNDFLTVGSMGHASSISLGFAKSNTKLKVICLDGDGAFLMHLGAAASIGASKIPNLIHIVLNNKSHDSVGGQPTAAPNTNMSQLATALGYPCSRNVKTSDQLINALKEAKLANELFFINVDVRKGYRENLPRPKDGCQTTKFKFMSSWSQ